MLFGVSLLHVFAFLVAGLWSFNSKQAMVDRRGVLIRASATAAVVGSVAPSAAFYVARPSPGQYAFNFALLLVSSLLGAAAGSSARRAPSSFAHGSSGNKISGSVFTRVANGVAVTALLWSLVDYLSYHRFILAYSAFRQDSGYVQGALAILGAFPDFARQPAVAFSAAVLTLGLCVSAGSLLWTPRTNRTAKRARVVALACSTAATVALVEAWREHALAQLDLPLLWGELTIWSAWVVTCVLISAVNIRWRQPDEPDTLVWLIPAVAASMFVGYALQMASVLDGSAIHKAVSGYEWLYARMLAAKWWLTAAAVSWSLLNLRSQLDTDQDCSPSLAFGVVLAGIAASAIIGSRAHHHDARISFRYASEPPEGVSRVPSCPSRLRESTVVLRAPPYSGSDEIDQQLLNDLRRKLHRSHATNPRTFEARAWLKAPLDTPIDLLLPVLRSAHRAQFYGVTVIAYEALPVETRTLGVLHEYRLCSAGDLVLSNRPGTKSLREFSTLGDAVLGPYPRVVNPL